MYTYIFFRTTTHTHSLTHSLTHTHNQSHTHTRIYSYVKPMVEPKDIIVVTVGSHVTQATAAVFVGGSACCCCLLCGATAATGSTIAELLSNYCYDEKTRTHTHTHFDNNETPYFTVNSETFTASPQSKSTVMGTHRLKGTLL